MIGVVEIEEAKQRARDAGLDLVEVSPDTDPPVCKIRDFGKWKYEQSKKDKANRAKSKAVELKEIRLGRSMKIDPHDIQIRLTQARRFLMEGHKVQIVQNFRGREMVHRERGYDRMRDIIDQLADISKLETPPRMAGRRMSIILAPDKPKIEQILRAKASAASKAAGEPKETAEVEIPAPLELAEPVEPAADPPSDPSGEPAADPSGEPAGDSSTEPAGDPPTPEIPAKTESVAPSTSD